MMRIAVLATNGCMVSAVYGVLDAVYAANYCIDKRYGPESNKKIDCHIVTVNDKPVFGYNGIQISPTKPIGADFKPDIVIVSATVEVIVDCCGDDIQLEHKEEIKAWLTQLKAEGTIISSFCTGSFLLASAGLLAGKTATTHWRSADLFRRIFPYVRLDIDRLLIDNEDIICSGGSMSYIDMVLYIIEKYIGREIASDTAKLIVFDPVRERQSPYETFKAQKKHEDQAVLKAQEWLESHFHKDVSMEELAEQVGLGSRTFKRRFKLATGENPLNYLQRIRIETAKQRLEKTTDSINKIIWSVGYEDVSSFRQLFKRFTGLTPKDYRQKFA
ncbi:GlxA family transcriptional regulator [Thalassotalea euphylliae]|uniref:GlxA family transcriptional regulator n=1 Tax=Thalassotalea euphylliae TaxID=1655234 RepID=UPI0036371C0D